MGCHLSEDAGYEDPDQEDESEQAGEEAEGLLGEEAATAWLGEARRRLRRVVRRRRLRLSKDQEDEVLQSAAIEILRQGRRVTLDPEHRWFLWGPLSHSLRTLIRNRTKEREERREGDDALTKTPDPGPSPQEEANRQDIRHKVEAALLALSPLERSVVEAIDLRGMTVKATAALTNQTASAVKEARKRAWRKLRHYLRSETEGQ